MVNHQLRRARLDRRWTYEYAAQEMGIGKKTLQRIELGKQHPRRSTIILICDTYGLPPEALGFSTSNEEVS